MENEPISWKGDEFRIAGELYFPSKTARPHPTLILCHGIPGKRKILDDPGYPFLADRFRREGFLVLIFNFRGTGPSGGNFDLLGWTRDLEGALDQLALRPEADPKRIYVMGFSAGAAVSIRVASRRKEIQALISCASPAHFDDWLTERGKSDFMAYAREVGIIRDPDFPRSVQEWETGFRVVKPLRWIGDIPPRPLLLIHGTADDVVGVGHAHLLHEGAGKGAELCLLEGAGHRLRLEQRAIGRAMEWLKGIVFRTRASAARPPDH